MAWVPGSRSKFGNWTSVPSLYSWNIAEYDVKPQSTTTTTTTTWKYKILRQNLHNKRNEFKHNAICDTTRTRNSIWHDEFMSVIELNLLCLQQMLKPNPILILSTCVFYCPSENYSSSAWHSAKEDGNYCSRVYDLKSCFAMIAVNNTQTILWTSILSCCLQIQTVIQFRWLYKQNSCWFVSANTHCFFLQIQYKYKSIFNTNLQIQYFRLHQVRVLGWTRWILP